MTCGLKKASSRQWQPHSSTLAWKIPWTEEPGRLQSMGSVRVGHNWAASLSLSRIGEGNGNPLQCSCLENPRDGGAWWAAVYGVTQSRTWLKQLSSSSNPFSPNIIYSLFSLYAIYILCSSSFVYFLITLCPVLLLYHKEHVSFSSAGSQADCSHCVPQVSRSHRPSSELAWVHSDQ